MTLNLNGACENALYNSGLWATYTVGTKVSFDDGGTFKDYIVHTASGCWNAPNTGAGAACWSLDANPCAPVGTAPTVSSTLPSSVKATTATLGGNATVQGTSAVTDKGIVWSLAATPTTSDNMESFGSGGLGVFSMTVTLPEYTRIYIRAYATNSEKTGYGSQVTLYTGRTPHTFTTHAAIDIHCESFTTGLESGQLGNISNVTQPVATAGIAYAEVTNWGFLYGTNLGNVDASSPSSLVGDTKVEVHISNSFGGLNLGNRYAEITGLTPGTQYFYKAYGTNPMGTGYGVTSTQNFWTTTCTDFYSCPWDSDVDNRWSKFADCSTQDGDELDASGTNAIAYHRHDWNTGAIVNLDADVTTNATTSGRAMTVLPYRLVVQSGSRVVQNNPVYIGGFQLIINNNGQYGHNGTMQLQNEGTAGADGHIARLVNDGSMLVDGSYNNFIKMTGLGEFCVFGTFTNDIGPGSVNDDYGTPEPSLPDTRYVNGRCVGTSTLPVELIVFSAKNVGNNTVEYHWVTGSEINNDRFEIELSTNANDWEMVGSVSGMGNTMDVTTYDFDVETHEKYKFTRLKQVDLDGTYSYSNIVFVGDKDNSTEIILINNGVFISSEDTLNLDIYNMSGIKVTNTQVPSGQNTIKFNNLSNGLYIIRVGSESFKVLINN